MKKNFLIFLSFSLSSFSFFPLSSLVFARDQVTGSHPMSSFLPFSLLPVSVTSFLQDEDLMETRKEETGKKEVKSSKKKNFSLEVRTEDVD